MCTAAVRPNRAISALGNASWFVMVPVALESVRLPLEAFDSVSVNALAALVVFVVEYGYLDGCR